MILRLVEMEFLIGAGLSYLKDIKKKDYNDAQHLSQQICNYRTRAIITRSWL